MGLGKRYLHSLHCQSSVSTDVHRIDPSLALAFYLPDRASFNDLAKKIGQVRAHRYCGHSLLRRISFICCAVQPGSSLIVDMRFVLVMNMSSPPLLPFHREYFFESLS